METADDMEGISGRKQDEEPGACLYIHIHIFVVPRSRATKLKLFQLEWIANEKSLQQITEPLKPVAKRGLTIGKGGGAGLGSIPDFDCCFAAARRIKL